MTNGNNKIVLKESKMSTVPLATSDDTGFCSGEDYMESEIHSPTDSSEDSLEVKVSVISLNKNKRKLAYDTPTKTETFTGPLKKRMCLKVKAESELATPFRPWSPPPTKNEQMQNFPIKSEVVSPPVPNSVNFSYFRPPSPVNLAHTQAQSEPVSLVVKRENIDSTNTFVNPNDIRVPVHPQITKLSTVETERMILKTNEQFPPLKVRTNLTQPIAHLNGQFNPSAHASHQNQPTAHTSQHAQTSAAAKKAEQRREQRNYKNMTRERRIEANARERTRVHTISAAFDTLRRAVPAYSHNQKLSKLSILRIACSYIMTLSSIVTEDSESEAGEPSVSECVDMVSKTIQREGKLRKKKDDNDTD